jgi:short-subunit dehydrogenase
MKINANQTVVITGAGSGIGRALSLEFSKLGCKLSLNDFNENNLDETKILCDQAGASSVFTSVFDVSDQQAMMAFAEASQKQQGTATIVINNAGIDGSHHNFSEIDIDDFKRVMDINLYGVIYGCKYFLPQLQSTNSGAIVNISSIFGLIAPPQFSDYCASKFAVRGFTEALATEMIGTPIQVHCIHPGGIATNIGGPNNQEFSKKYLKTPPEKLAQRIVKGIRKNEPKIVFGHQSLLAWVGENFIPQKTLNFIVRQSTKDTMRQTN